MGRSAFKPEDCIAALNTAKKAYDMSGKPFAKDTLLKSFKACGLPANKHFWSVFMKSGLIKKVAPDQYLFTSKDPIFVGVLKKIQHRYLETLRSYKKKPVPEVVPEEVPVSEHAIELAVNLLKENGYIVLAPVDVIYRVL